MILKLIGVYKTIRYLVVDSRTYKYTWIVVVLCYVKTGLLCCTILVTIHVCKLFLTLRLYMQVYPAVVVSVDIFEFVSTRRYEYIRNKAQSKKGMMDGYPLVRGVSFKLHYSDTFIFRDFNGWKIISHKNNFLKHVNLQA